MRTPSGRKASSSAEASSAETGIAPPSPSPLIPSGLRGEGGVDQLDQRAGAGGQRRDADAEGAKGIAQRGGQQRRDGNRAALAEPFDPERFGGGGRLQMRDLQGGDLARRWNEEVREAG